VLNLFSECYLLNVMRIDRLTDVQRECQNALQVNNASKIDILG